MNQTAVLRLHELVLLALKAEGADMGILRNYDADDDKLTIIGQHGFPQEYLSHFHSVKPFDHSSCGRAFGLGTTILISDIEHDATFKRHCKCLRSLNTEFRAVKSTPVLNSRGRKLGVFSVYFKAPKTSWSVNSNDKFLLEMARFCHK